VVYDLPFHHARRASQLRRCLYSNLTTALRWCASCGLEPKPVGASKTVDGRKTGYLVAAADDFAEKEALPQDVATPNLGGFQRRQSCKPVDVRQSLFWRIALQLFPRGLRSFVARGEGKRMIKITDVERAWKCKSAATPNVLRCMRFAIKIYLARSEDRGHDLESGIEILPPTRR
jgi:hypothetical protein